MSNLLRMIHTMRPPGKKPKKKKKKGKGGEMSPSSKPLDPLLEAKVMKYPGLSMRDDPDRVKGLLEVEEKKVKVKKEEEESGGGGGKSEDARVTEVAMTEVSSWVLTTILLLWYYFHEHVRWCSKRELPWLLLLAGT